MTHSKVVKKLDDNLESLVLSEFKGERTIGDANLIT